MTKEKQRLYTYDEYLKEFAPKKYKEYQQRKRRDIVTEVWNDFVKRVTRDDSKT